MITRTVNKHLIINADEKIWEMIDDIISVLNTANIDNDIRCLAMTKYHFVSTGNFTYDIEAKESFRNAFIILFTKNGDYDKLYSVIKSVEDKYDLCIDISYHDSDIDNQIVLHHWD